MSISNIKVKKEDTINFKIITELLKLMKPRVMSLVLFTCMVGLLIAPINVDLTTACISLFAVAIGSGAAGTLNMWYESDLDALMSRTCLRPIPTGKVKKDQALYFGIILSTLSVSLIFFSSRRRHTRLTRDWSSDVCSSDLTGEVRRPTAQVNMTRDITLGFINLSNSVIILKLIVSSFLTLIFEIDILDRKSVV